MALRRTLFACAAGVLAAVATQTVSAQVFASGMRGVNGAAVMPADVPYTPPTPPGTPIHEIDGRKVISMKVRNGVFTVDGLVGKVHLNYDIEDAGYLYFYVPGAGVAVVSLNKEPDSQLVKAAFHESKLEFSVGGHQFALNSAEPMLATDKHGKKTVVDAYVRFDGGSNNLARTPMMGYGKVIVAPYVWPASLPTQKIADADPNAPPLPSSVLPHTVAQGNAPSAPADHAGQP